MPEILFAPEIAFCGLDRCMPEQELNLLKAVSRGTTKILRNMRHC